MVIHYTEFFFKPLYFKQIIQINALGIKTHGTDKSTVRQNTYHGTEMRLENSIVMKHLLYNNYPFKSLAVTLHTTRFNIKKFYINQPRNHHATTHKDPQHSSKTCCFFTNKVLITWNHPITLTLLRHTTFFTNTVWSP